jgi:hypothetical protein
MRGAGTLAVEGHRGLWLGSDTIASSRWRARILDKNPRNNAYDQVAPLLPRIARAPIMVSRGLLVKACTTGDLDVPWGDSVWRARGATSRVDRRAPAAGCTRAFCHEWVVVCTHICPTSAGCAAGPLWPIGRVSGYGRDPMAPPRPSLFPPRGSLGETTRTAHRPGPPVDRGDTSWPTFPSLPARRLVRG